MKDILNRKDIEHLVTSFYERVKTDDMIGFFFTDIVNLDWDVHMPIMYDFWETTLLGSMTYTGNPMTRHFELNKKATILPEHFDRWIQLWESTVFENFKGIKADEAVKRAGQIAELMKFKIGHQKR